MIATSDFLTALECTKFVFGRGSTRTPLGELTALPDLLAGIRGHTSNGEGKGRGRKGWDPPFRKFLDLPLHFDFDTEDNEPICG